MRSITSVSMTVHHSRDFSTVLTQRLKLTPAGQHDLDAMAELHADERVWRHMPSRRHTSAEQTRDDLIERERQWATDGLGYWIARLREPVGQLDAGGVAGLGGCAVPHDGTWWNLHYRLTPEVHGHGVAGEICSAAIRAACEVDADRPVVAFLLEHNRASKATAERAGLTFAWRGPDTGNPDSDAVRLIYVDRQLDSQRLDALIQHG